MRTFPLILYDKIHPYLKEDVSKTLYYHAFNPKCSDIIDTFHHKLKISSHEFYRYYFRDVNFFISTNMSKWFDITRMLHSLEFYNR